jgi:hypothetical protein
MRLAKFFLFGAYATAKAMQLPACIGVLVRSKRDQA